MMDVFIFMSIGQLLKVEKFNHFFFFGNFFWPIFVPKMKMSNLLKKALNRSAFQYLKNIDLFEEIRLLKEVRLPEENRLLE